MKQNTVFGAVFFIVAFLLTSALQAQVLKQFNEQYKEKVRGNMTMIANGILNRYVEGGASPETPYSGTTFNDNLDMRYIDIDDDQFTFSSSSATLSIVDSDGCYSIKYAALYWSGIYPFENQEQTGVRHAIEEVKLKLPGESVYRDITAKEVVFDGKDSDRSNVRLRSPYACYADITDLLGNLPNVEGEYTVANVHAAEGKYSGASTIFGTGTSAGWTIFVVYEDQSLPARFITTFDGFSWVQSSVPSVNVPISGFSTNPTGPVRVDLMTIALEGDQNAAGDSFYLNSDRGSFRISDEVSAANNYFNSKISKNGQKLTDRIPNSENTLGYDSKIISTVDLLNNNETEATMRFTTNQDSYFPFFVAFSAEIYEPDIRMMTSVRDASGANLSDQEVAMGSKIYYHIEFENAGNDHARDFTIRDLLPVTVNKDVQVESTSEGISYQYDQESGELLFSIADNDGEFKVGAQGSIVISVSVATDCNKFTAACSHIVKNQAFATYTGVESGIVQEDASFSGVDGCNIGREESVNFLVNTAHCIYERDEVLQCLQMELVAGEGFSAYTWKDNTGQVIGNTRTITIDEPGVYTVFKELEEGSLCFDMEENITVTGVGGAAVLSDIRLIDRTDVLCNGEATGSITVQASGGLGELRYGIAGKGVFQTSGVFNNLEAGIYTVIVRDERECELSVDVEISQPDAISVQLQEQNVDQEVCVGDRDARVLIDISGGTPPYATSLNYKDNFVDNQFEFFGLSGEEHNVIYIRDAVGCEYAYEIPLANPVNIMPVVDISYECEGAYTSNRVVVEVNPEVSGQVMYSLDGAPLQMGNSYSNLGSGEHVIEVTHANGCVQGVSFIIEDIAPLELRLEVNELNEITAVASGGRGTYRYEVNGNSLGEVNTYRIYQSANYTVSVTDAKGCTLSSTIAMDFVDIEIPKVFTPNGDGYQDSWTIKNIEAYPGMKVIIYDRYGRELVKLPPGAGWDGVYKGSLLPTGDYWYTLKLNNEKDNREFVGHFTLYR